MVKRRAHCRPLFRPAAKLIAISECTRADAVRVLGFDRRKLK